MNGRRRLVGEWQRGIMFTVGVGLTIAEAAAHKVERPFLLVLLAAMMGVPVAFPKGPGT